MGNGSKLLLAFHGYGNSPSLFQPFQRYLQNDFTILSIELPHHGKSTWEQHKAVSKKDLKELAEELMQQFGADKFSLMGYSMGGRVCLTLMELLPAKIERCLLIAADGLVFNPFYYFVTQTFVGQRMFRKFLTEPGRYMSLADWLRKRQLIDATRYRFFMNYVESEQARAFLLNVWPTMRELIPSGKRLRAAIHTYHIPVFIFMGIHDRIIPAQHAKKFSKDLSSVKLFILDKGHRVFDYETLPQMADCLIKGTC